MVSYLLNGYSNIYAFCEWHVVDSQGVRCKNGKYIYIQELWINKLLRKKFGRVKIIRRLTQLMADNEDTQNCSWVYWEYRKYNYRLSKLIDKNKFIRRYLYGRKQLKPNSCATTAD